MVDSRGKVTLVQLRYFIRVAELKSMSKAAEEMFVAQSAVSTSITQLERILGAQLFIRQRSKGVALTELGKTFYESILGVFSTLDAAVDALAPEKMQGKITAGFFTTLAQFYLPGVAERIQKDFPELTIDFRELGADGIVQALESRKIEVALAYDFDYGKDVDFLPIRAAGLYAAVSEHHKFANYESITLAELAEEQLVLLNLGKSSNYFLSVFYREGVRPKVKYRFGSFETVRSMVARGNGYTVLNQAPVHGLTNEGLRLVTIPISDAGSELQMGLAFRRGEEFSRKAELFHQSCVSSIEEVFGARKF